MIITGTGSSEGTWTLKRTSIDHYRDRILNRDMDSEKDESRSLQGQDPRQGHGQEKGRFMNDHNWDRILDRNMDREKMSHDHYRDRILDRDNDREKDEA
jgi:hypothetical protein